MGQFIHIQYFKKTKSVQADTAAILLNEGLDLVNKGESYLQFGRGTFLQKNPKNSLLGNVFACPELSDSFEPENLSGEFAFVFYSNIDNESYLSRDLFGTKSLYYYYDDAILIAASSIRLILCCLPKTPGMNTPSLTPYFDLSNNESSINRDTFFEHIYRVLPGEICRFNKHGKHDYFNSPPDLKNNTSTAAFFKKTLAASIGSRLAKKQKVAANLSGGLDSSSIVCLLSQYFKIAPETLYFDAEIASANEVDFAQIVAQQHHLNLHKEKKPKELSTAVKQNIFLAAEPDPMVVPAIIYNAIYQKAQDIGCNTIFSGQGGDSIVGYGWNYLEECWQSKNYTPMLQHLNGHSLAHFLIKKLKKKEFLKSLILLSHKPSTLFFMAKKIGYFVKQKFYKKEEWLLKKYKTTPSTSQLKSTDEDIQHYLANNNLDLTVKSMELINVLDQYFNLTTTYPFLNKDLLVLGAKYNKEANFDQGKQRGLLRNAMMGILPEAIRQRTSKANFADFTAEITLGLYQELKHELDNPENTVWKFISYETFKKNIGKLVSGNANSNNALLCYRTINLSIWLQYYAA